jgi:polyisoprenoid-binding protein YceI
MAREAACPLLQPVVMSPTHTTWEIDPAHSELRFTVSHLVIAKISGRFGHWRTTVRLDEADVPCSSVEVAIDAATLDTGNPVARRRPALAPVSGRRAPTLRSASAASRSFPRATATTS